MSDASSHRAQISSSYPRCVDGRAAEVFIQWNEADDSWEVAKRGEEAQAENGPQFLGASLVFVRALEVVEGWDRDDAFDLVEKASREVGLDLQVHLDDAHGEHDFASMTDEELVELMNEHHTGCGFAKYAWGDEGTDVIEEAKARHWRLQLLVGDHEEDGAVINYKPELTFDTATAVEAGESQFNTDVAAAREVFEQLGEMIHSETFADEAEKWMVDTYKDVVVALKGVETADEVAVAAAE